MSASPPQTLPQIAPTSVFAWIGMRLRLLLTGEFQSAADRRGDLFVPRTGNHSVNFRQHQSGDRVIVVARMRGSVMQVIRLGLGGGQQSIVALTRDHEIDGLRQLRTVGTFSRNMSPGEKRHHRETRDSGLPSGRRLDRTVSLLMLRQVR